MREDWELENLGDFAEYEKGKKPKRQRKDKTEKFKYPYINIEAFEKGIYSSYSDGENCRFCSAEDFLMVWDGSRSGLVGKGVDGALGSTLMRINFPGIKNDYAYYFLQSKFQEINTRAKGTGTPHVDPNLLWGYKFPIPSLSEQRAIVSKIEELLSSLDSGIADLKKAQEQLKLYRQAVLKKAFEGGLNHQLNNGKLPADWKIHSIKEVCENIKVGIVIKPTQYYSSDGTGIPAFRSANVREFKVNDSNWVYFTEEGNNANPRTKLKHGDVLIVRSGYPGTSCVVPKSFEGANAIDILIATPDKKLILSDYLCSFNNSPLAKGLFSEGSRGVAQKHLNVGVYSKLSIPIPPISEQSEIVKILDSQLTSCENAEETIEQNLKKTIALKQTILKNAFEGKLLSQKEIEKCKQAADYEPASKLLERIKAEKV